LQSGGLRFSSESVDLEWFRLHSFKILMLLSPLAKRQNSTLKYWQLYCIQLLKWSSWRHFNKELEAPRSDSISIWRLQIAHVRAITKPQTRDKLGRNAFFLPDFQFRFKKFLIATEHTLSLRKRRAYR
jgi:hypothetical protein